MSDNFYDFDKDDAFDESYLKHSSNPPKKKEFEIEIPVPRQNPTSSAPVQRSSRPVQKAKKAKRRKLSPVALIFSILGIIVSCILVFVVSLVLTVYVWVKFPDSEEAPVSENTVEVHESTDMVEIKDDGKVIVDDVPMYTGSPSDSSSSSSKSDDKDESESDSGDSSEDGESSESTEASDGDSEITVIE